MCLFIIDSVDRADRYYSLFLSAIGVYPDVSLAEARSQRQEAKRTFAAGNDPSLARKRVCFRTCMLENPAVGHSTRGTATDDIAAIDMSPVNTQGC
ncbi:DUF4102 domain-containing protein [Citrobacter sp. RHBSTW-00696]|nr:DUF4102 domain-containing protein [Citrobacter sp. RHBSTW-00089]MBD9975689.1 DUF4102 domain-containing protein [Citrobacter braakii]QLR26528.1 DUF4102 domain-containing protein [Citrobacter sp. RHBSTW-01013]QLU53657.1 DUF4102 domain-containing protein [Citrobacter sp. RHBSTW-00696]MBJ9225077.1 DUF4102 domain-containing protein [Citrobacter braakii]